MILMPTAPARPCAAPGCPALVARGRRCPAHARAEERRRGSAARRGYGTAWQQTSAAYLAAHPICIDCGAPATVPDYDPVARRDLVAMGVPDPDAWHRLKPRCGPCHNWRTVRVDGGFGRARTDQRDPHAAAPLRRAAAVRAR